MWNPFKSDKSPGPTQHIPVVDTRTNEYVGDVKVTEVSPGTVVCDTLRLVPAEFNGVWVNPGHTERFVLDGVLIEATYHGMDANDEVVMMLKPIGKVI